MTLALVALDLVTLDLVTIILATLPLSPSNAFLRSCLKKSYEGATKQCRLKALLCFCNKAMPNKQIWWITLVANPAHEPAWKRQRRS